MKAFITCLLLSATTGLDLAASTEPIGTLTLEQAQDLAERRHPQLAEARAQVEAAAGRVQAAGAPPNPELIAGAQQVPFKGEQSNQREYIAGVAQPLPLGGRLVKAREAEALEREIRVRGLEITRRDLRRRVHSAFATALYQEQACQTQQQMVESADKLVALAKARVKAGESTPEEQGRAEIELARARLELERGKTLREQARLGLAGAIGDPNLKMKALVGQLDVAFEIPTLAVLATNLSVQPELLQANLAARAGEARIALAQAERIPDVKVEALYHRLEATRENTFDLGVSIPLPLFNRNQGKLREARAEAAAASARARLTRDELTLRLRESHAQLTAALARAGVFKLEILPRAGKLLQAAEARHAAGDGSLADVLAARRDWASLQLSQLESLRDVMQAWAEMTRWMPAP